MSTPQQAPSGPPLRALAMVLIALAIAFAGIGAMSLSGSGSDSQAADVVPSVAPVTAAPDAPGASTRPTTTTPAPASATAQAASASTVDRDSVVVRVFNNSTVAGLAADTASTLESTGWTIAETGNYSSGNVPTTTAYYSATSASEKKAAQEIAAELGITAEQRFTGIASASPGVIVIVTAS